VWASLVVFLAVASAARAADLVVAYDVMVPMRDGVVLATDVFRPRTEAKLPVLLIRTPYNKADERDVARFFASHGWAVLLQDVRGRYDSEGVWTPFVNEADDGYDAVEWAAAQPFSNGKVATSGGSYAAIDQWLAATRRSKHLAAIVSEFAPSDLYEGFLYPGGAFQEAIGVTWAALVSSRVKQSASLQSEDWPRVFLSMPLTEALRSVGHATPFFREWLRHPAYDAHWKSLSWQGAYEGLDVPVFAVHSWFDIFNVGKGNIDNFLKLRARGAPGRRGAHRLVVGPWEHGPHGTKVGDVEFGEVSRMDLDEAALRWLENVVKGAENGADRDAPVKVFTMGENAWHDYADWPPPGTRTVAYYLGGRRANSSLGEGALATTLPAENEPAETFTYDPKDPVPNMGGGNCCWPQILPWGPLDQRPVERRDDVLVFSTPALASALRVTGPVVAKIWVKSSAPDTDFAVKLVDVHPGGFAMNLADGILRARYRGSFEKPEPLAPDRAYELTIDLGATSHLFLEGHRVRVEVSSANFPRYSRNTNTGNVPELDTETRPARQTVLHDARHPSRILLPVLP